jgi:predicted nucleic acid-binding protein
LSLRVARFGEEAGNLLKRLRPSHGVGLGDAVIAATAIKYKLILWTRNPSTIAENN